jgi:hypothetical protein
MDEVFHRGQTHPTRASSSVLFCAVAMMCAIGCGGSSGQQLESGGRTLPNAVQQLPVPALLISTSPTIKVNEPIHIHWKISNDGRRTIYVYSTILSSKRRLNTEIDSAKKLVTLDFTFNLISPILPYAPPPLNFIAIAPGQSSEGSFETQPVKEIVGHVRPDGAADLRVLPGEWHVNALIGYGYETQSVEAAFSRADRQGKENPINALVRWQSTVVSEPIFVKFTD